MDHALTFPPSNLQPPFSFLLMRSSSGFLCCVQGIHRGQFVQLIARMQALKRMPTTQNMGGMNMGMGSMAGMGMGMGMGSLGGMPPVAPMGSMGGSPGMYGPTMPRGAAPAPNPLFNAPPSPMGSQPGMMMGGAAGMQPQGSMQGGAASPHGTASPAPPAPAPGGADGEAQMMQQLMAEINQLRAELNQN